MLLQEWLIDKIPADLSLQSVTQIPHYLLSHCTEKTMCIASEKLWQTIFAKFGLTLTPLSAGCCGMAGSYGHELEHVENSKELFNMDWKKLLETHASSILVTGYSCRTQAKRFMKMQLQHPIQLLANLIK